MLSALLFVSAVLVFVVIYAIQVLIVCGLALLIVVQKRQPWSIVAPLSTLPFLADVMHFAQHEALSQAFGWTWTFGVLVLYFSEGGGGPRKRKRRRRSLKEYLRLPPVLNPLPT